MASLESFGGLGPTRGLWEATVALRWLVVLHELEALATVASVLGLGSFGNPGHLILLRSIFRNTILARGAVPARCVFWFDIIRHILDESDTFCEFFLGRSPRFPHSCLPGFGVSVSVENAIFLHGIADRRIVVLKLDLLFGTGVVEVPKSLRLEILIIVSWRLFQ